MHGHNSLLIEFHIILDSWLWS